MKKPARAWVLLLLVLFSFLFGGCSTAHGGAAEPVLQFSCQAEAEYGGKQTSFQLDCSTPGVFICATNTLTYTWSGGKFSAAGEGLEHEFAGCPLPDDSLPVLLKKLLEYAAQEGAVNHSNGNVWKGSWNGQEFALTADRSTGLLIRLSLPQKGLTVQFHDYRLSK